MKEKKRWQDRMALPVVFPKMARTPNAGTPPRHEKMLAVHEKRAQRSKIS